MNKSVDKKIPCPKCGHQQEFKLWTTIDIYSDPKMRDAVLSQSLFSYKCDGCGYAAPLNYPCVYNDPKNKLVFYVFPNYKDEHLQQLDNAQTQKMLDDGYVFRVVRSGNELAEKIVIFDHELDDRVIELCKLYMVRELKKQRSDFKVMSAYYNHGKEGHLVVVFDENGKGVTAPLPEDMYEKMKDSFASYLEDYPSEEELVVDVQWALEALKASQPDNNN